MWNIVCTARAYCKISTKKRLRIYFIAMPIHWVYFLLLKKSLNVCNILVDNGIFDRILESYIICRIMMLFPLIDFSGFVKYLSSVLIYFWGHLDQMSNLQWLHVQIVHEIHPGFIFIIFSLAFISTFCTFLYLFGINFLSWIYLRTISPRLSYSGCSVPRDSNNWWYEAAYFNLSMKISLCGEAIV